MEPTARLQPLGFFYVMGTAFQQGSLVPGSTPTLLQHLSSHSSLSLSAGIASKWPAELRDWKACTCKRQWLQSNRLHSLSRAQSAGMDVFRARSQKHKVLPATGFLSSPELFSEAETHLPTAANPSAPTAAVMADKRAAPFNVKPLMK